ncbi:ATP-binding protein [Myceligenerans indicum]|uniref:ATP-binding protein n=1 Tax=Myceligenerans indicum TaxID=2593663 RepID=A0ABS1LJQ0_9MICO|nr:ATP-binding protein [Myceligenerans indicum]MBL0885797.1 ATP-binding protein [Myceligenerans indicum]
MTLDREFFGRDRILADLSRRLDAVSRRGRGQILAVRGRRQVGKSTLLEHFVQSADVPYVFTTGRYGAAIRQQIDGADRALSESRRPLPDLDLIASSSARSWEDWLTRLAVSARSGPVVVVLDEFPWQTAADPSLEGVLQVVWDRVLEKLPVLLVLVGSDVAMMSRLTEHDRPLFGRVRPLVVPALNLAEAAQALPGWEPTGVIDAALVTGGYPRLLADLADSGRATVQHYVHDGLRDPYSPLVTTARLTLDAEFPSPQDATRVLAAIGADETANPGFNDILGTITNEGEGQSARTATTRALKILTEIKGLIEREQPALAKPSSKLRRYRITDPYLRFWYRYVESSLDQIERGRADLAVARFDRDWSSWRGRSVEPLVRDSLVRLAATDERLAGIQRFSPWWRRARKGEPDVEVDVVGTDRSTPLLVGSIKWRPGGRIAPQEVAELRAHRALIPGADNAMLAAITPEGLQPEGVDIALGSQDLVEAWSPDVDGSTPMGR